MVLLFMLLTQTVFANGREGHGGVGLLRYQQNALISATLLDFYQGGEFPNFLVIPKEGSPLNFEASEGQRVIVDQEAKTILDRALDAFPADQKFKSDFLSYYELVEKKLIYTDKQKKLIDSNDLGDVSNITIPKDAYLQNVATFGSDGLIRITQYIYNDYFSATDRAGLIAHEVVYTMLRDLMGVTTSEWTRKIVAFMFAKDLSELNKLEIKQLIQRAYAKNTFAIESSGPLLQSSRFIRFKLMNYEGTKVLRNPDTAVCKIWLKSKNQDWKIVGEFGFFKQNKTIVDVELSASRLLLAGKSLSYWCATDNNQLSIQTEILNEHGETFFLHRWVPKESLATVLNIFEFSNN